MKRLTRLLLQLRRIRTDQSGQDMIEYALMAAAVAILVAGILPPRIMPAVNQIFTKIIDLMSSR